ncbi:MAG: GNAT family N-acetyltransferase [Candidatus Methanoplasma sp.]|jgi:ribosomal protein S18 acetylase RimI-like enzyme|nr:GNAT family N-acetyltransferase [Candidatus Methanoplasma sp.]
MEFLGPSSAKELSEMAKSIWMEHYTTFLDPRSIEIIVEDWQSESAIIGQMSEGHLYSFIVHEGRNIGYRCVLPQGDDLFVSKIYVDKEHRGQGFGSRALTEMLDYGRGIGSKRAYLHVNKHNEIAIRAYKAKGFVIEESRVIPLDNGICLNDYVMVYHYG